MKKYEEEHKQRELEALSRPPPEETAVDPESEIDPEPAIDEMPPPVEPSPVPDGSPQLEVTNELKVPRQLRRYPRLMVLQSGVPEAMMFSIYSLLFGGQSKWPEAVGVAVAFEGDAYVLRALIINGGDNKGSAIPFVPQFVSGPALVPESPSIFPADTDLFVAASLDYPQVYDGMVKALAAADETGEKIRWPAGLSAYPC